MAPPNFERRVATAGASTCAIREDGSLWCWGANLSVPPGTKAPFLYPHPSPLLPQMKFRSLGANGGYTCAVTSEGALWCWGNKNDWTYPGEPPTLQAGLSGVSHVSLGRSHGCALREEGTLWCWGRNLEGQLGLGVEGDDMPPTQVPGLKEVVQVSAGRYGTCAVLASGELWCWGGLPGSKINPTPTLVPGLPPVAQISLGDGFACALLQGGKIWCWGDNDYGQLSDGSQVQPFVVEVPCIQDATQIATSGQADEDQQTCAVRSDGSVWCWGAKVTLVKPGKTPTPYPIAGISDATEVATYARHTCARRTNGEFVCWGANNHGQLGIEELPYSTSPVEAFPGTKIKALAFGEVSDGASFQCLVKGEGGALCWGFNGGGWLGAGSSKSFELKPVEPVGLFSAEQVGLGRRFGCALQQGSVWCWGSNDFSLGTGTPGQQPTPVKLAGIDQVERLHVVYNRTYAIRQGGTLWVWGHGSVNQILENVDTLLVPTQVDGLTGVIDVTASATDACVLRGKGELWCWGDGKLFQEKPAQVQGLAPIVRASVGLGDVCVVDENQKLWCWGGNGFNQLGTGDNKPQAAPVEIGGLPPIRDVAMGWTYTCAVGVDETVWCWGNNPGGEVGNTMTLRSSVPVQVPGVSGAIGLVAGLRQACAYLKDGSARCWGWDDFGQLGDGRVAIKESATPVVFP